MLIAIFLLIFPSKQITCNTNGSMISGYSDNNDLHFVFYTEQESNQLFLFMGSTPGGSAMFYENYGDFKQLGNLLFLDVEGAGYSRNTGKVTTIQGLAQAYADGLNQLIKCLPPFEELIIVTGGIMSKVAIQLKDKNIPQLNTFILLSPILDLKLNMQYLPTISFNMGLIDYQERMELEAYTLALPNPTFQQYLVLLNKIIKYSGDMQHYDYRKYETDTLNLDLTNYMNTDDIRKLYSASRFFYTQNQELYNAIQDSLNQKVQINTTEFKFLFFLPQFSLNVNIPGTMAYLNQYINDHFQLHLSDDGFPQYAQKGPIFIIQDCGDRIYIDKKDLLKQLIQANIKI